MIVAILEAVSKRLKEDFPETRVYVNEVKQGLHPPCFLVAVLEPSRARLVGEWWRQEQLFDVAYFPKMEDNNELYAIGGALFDTLETIALPDGGLRGTSMRFEVVDGVLHFFVKYTVFLRRKEPREHMEVLRVKENVKE